MKVTKRTLFGLAGAAALAMTSIPTTALAWEPTKPIDFVIMAGPGGGADQIARFLQSVAEKKDLTSRPLVPNNKGGGSGAEALIALDGASDPDHTILVTLNSFFTTPLRQANLGIDIQTFTPIAMMGGRSRSCSGCTRTRGITTIERVRRAPCSRMGGEYVMGGTGARVKRTRSSSPTCRAPTISTSNTSPMTVVVRSPRTSQASRSWRPSTTRPRPRAFTRPATFVPLLAFSDERMPAYPDVPTIKELGPRFLATTTNARSLARSGDVRRGRDLLPGPLHPRSTRVTSGKAT